VYEHFDGTLERLAGEIAVVEVAGVGYRLRVPASTATVLRVGRQVRLYVSHRIGQDTVHLCGFATREEREVFELVCTVTGVGSSIALAILSALSIERFREAVLRGEAKVFEKIRGIGKKTSQRLILELRGTLEETELRPPPPPEVAAVAEDALKALLALGFGPADAESRLRRALGAAPAEIAVGDLVRLASRG
jgi:Holliday junction DNA helicase RuvA